MFGYKLIKNVEIENLKSELANAKETVATQTIQIDELNNKVNELVEKIKKQEKLIGKLTETSNVESDSVEEKPVKKKVRRKNTKKNTKKEE